MDNLNVHRNELIVNMILEDDHKIVFRAPYYAVDGAIEYVFNTLQTTLMIHFNEIDSMDELRNRVDQVINNIVSFRPYFEHVGFVY